MSPWTGRALGRYGKVVELPGVDLRRFRGVLMALLASRAGVEPVPLVE